MDMKCLFLFALAVSVYAQAPPVTDVPESTFLADQAAADATEAAREAEDAAAHADATELLAAKGAGACKSLADATEADVKNNIKAEQDILNKIDKGAACPQEGQQAVTAMQNKLTKAESDKKAADKAHTDALSTEVDFGKHKFNSLTKGQCSTFYNSGSYKAAETKVANAKKKKDQAAGTVTQAKKDLQAAKDAAVEAKRKCQCNTYKAHEKALADANAKVKKSNDAAWTKAAHLKCVIAGKTTNACTVPAMPKVKAVTLAAGVNAGRCSSWEGKAQCYNAVCGGCNGASNIMKRIYRQTGDNSWNAGCFMKSEIPKGRTTSYKLSGAWNSHGTGRGGSVHAMWGFRLGDKTLDTTSHGGQKHYYGSIDYAYYCHAANQQLHIYEKGSSKGAQNCYCGTKFNFDLEMFTNGNVVYKGYSPQQGSWKTCRTVGGSKGKGPYVVDESIYGKSCDLTDFALYKKEGGSWVAAL